MVCKQVYEDTDDYNVVPISDAEMKQSQILNASQKGDQVRTQRDLRRLLRSSKNTESFEEMEKSENLNHSIPAIDVSKISNEDSKRKGEASISHHSADPVKEADSKYTEE